MKAVDGQIVNRSCLKMRSSYYQLANYQPADGDGAHGKRRDRDRSYRIGADRRASQPELPKFFRAAHKNHLTMICRQKPMTKGRGAW